MSQNTLDIAEQLNQDTESELVLRSATITIIRGNISCIAQHPHPRLNSDNVDDILALLKVYPETPELIIYTNGDSLLALKELLQQLPSACKLTLLGRLTPTIIGVIADHEQLKHLCLDARTIPQGYESRLLASNHLHSLDLRQDPLRRKVQRFMHIDYSRPNSYLFSSKPSHIAHCIEERNMFTSTSITELHYYRKSIDCYCWNSTIIFGSKGLPEQLPAKIASRLEDNRTMKPPLPTASK